MAHGPPTKGPHPPATPAEPVEPGPRPEAEEIARDFEFFQSLFSAPQIDLDEIVGAAEEIAESNLARFPRISQTARQEALGTAVAFDRFLEDRFFRNIERVLPDFDELLIEPQRQALLSTAELQQQLASGEVPEDVARQQDILLAETSSGQGLFGQSAEFRRAEQRGFTSLQLQLLGADLAAQQLPAATRSLQASVFALQPPVTDPSTLFLENMRQITGISTVSPTATLDVGGRVAIANAESAWAAQVSSFNSALSVYATEVEKQASEPSDLETALAVTEGLAGISGAGGISGVFGGLF